MSLIVKIYHLIPRRYRDKLHFPERYLVPLQRIRYKKVVKNISSKDSINVAFFAMSVGFWKYDELYKLMDQHSKYKPYVLIAPSPEDPIDIQKKHRDDMIAFFSGKGYKYTENIADINPDILFYAQPYRLSQAKSLSPLKFLNKLICYVPYAFFISNYKWAYDQRTHNVAWKLFYPTELHRKNAQELAFNKGANIEVVGYPLYDSFNKREPKTDPWKIKDPQIKRFIWAVHHSIFSDDMADCSTFLIYAEKMLEIAKENQHLQFAFKPHPHLREHLYRHPDFGPEKTEKYYQRWNILPNTILAEGNYIDLFLTSDALIHDCGSFTVEYLYMQKPVLYIGYERDKIMCNFGKEALKANYNLKEISLLEFLDIFKTNNDFKKEIRQDVLKKHLIPPHGKSFSQNILDILNQELSL